MSNTFQSFIGGEWVGARSGETFETRNPANTDEVVGRYPKCGADDARETIDAARAAQPA
jgi:acyl-CoA reductase-like NAD-dependent aldehyde dehydrogenase